MNYFQVVLISIFFKKQAQKKPLSRLSISDGAGDENRTHAISLEG